MIEIDRAQFEHYVAEAVAALPPEIAKNMDNVAFMVEAEAEGGGLLGLYQGVPLTKRRLWSSSPPDRITIYQDPICAQCNTAKEVEAEVQRVVKHEIGHHFGIGDARLRELGY
jgi:predicted Zn-dependent protease with MMP-like domain